MKPKKTILTSIFVIAILALAVISGSFLLDKSQMPKTFERGTTFGGVDVGGLSLAEASNKVNGYIDSKVANASLTLRYEDDVWSFGSGNFAVNSNADALLEGAIKKGRPGDYYKDQSGIKIEYVFNGMEDKLEEVFAEIEVLPQDATITFNPNVSPEFIITPHVVGVTVDRARLSEELLAKLKTSSSVSVDIPVIKTVPEKTLESLQKYTKKQSEFSTDYASSTIQRKENINLAFSKINGTVLNSGEEFSFNAVVGERTAENGFKEAKVILAGEYENGIGGGVCQASTTLYNAVIRAGLDVVEVNPHSMPASYVPLSLDAMVSWGYSDLKFVNNTDGPLFIKTITDGSKLTATIYGNTLKENQKAVPRAELIKTLPHEGDKVVADIEGKYADKIMFKGEYVRETSPKEGYESRAYIDFYENGILVNSKEIRHDIYKSKQGVVYEGAEILPEGMTLPPNNVSIIAPQT